MGKPRSFDVLQDCKTQHADTLSVSAWQIRVGQSLQLSSALVVKRAMRC